ncbi:uncharacterized protein N7482_005576 [Penicillium canariense]|uniref:Uncharacterized protein n=1 Tax=Penicillium canariense TaxID=189055 RepID=A0A9W9LNC2_9EURO|nr:uncharacterized protein N7482_005576 [Penicillium canariense]KAJ5166795.1 hypothetical protein N7482_005576 [Penicillium canariense]
MRQFPSPFPPLNTSQRTRHPASDTSSPPSSRTTSPPSSPTSTLRRRHQPTQVSPHHLFNLSFHPHPTTHPRAEPEDSGSRPVQEHAHEQENDSLSTAHPSHPQGVSVLPCAVLRGRSSLMVVRRRPSAVDMALSEERSRCDENSIERQGLDLMEPRPVDMNQHRRMDLHRNSIFRAAAVQQPRFVMGGIFEVMEGRA